MGAQRDLSALQGASMYNIADWTSQLANAGVSSQQADPVGRWLNGVLGVDFTKPPA